MAQGLSRREPALAQRRDKVAKAPRQGERHDGNGTARCCCAASRIHVGLVAGDAF